jgi:hypothetical protein
MFKKGSKDFCQVYEEKDFVRIITKRFYHRPGFLLTITISWSFMTYIFFMASMSEQETPIILYIFFICISAALSWYVAVIIFNKTHIVVNNPYVYVSHKPIPWFGNKHFDILEINMFLVKEEENNPNDYYHGKGDVSYIVDILRTDGKSFVITRLKKREQAEVLKQKIEEHVYKKEK